MTLTALYRVATGDTSSHPTTITAAFRRLDDRRKRLLRDRIQGHSLHQIARAERISHGSVQSACNLALEAMRKAIANEPRYNRTGHPGAGAHLARR